MGKVNKSKIFRPFAWLLAISVAAMLASCGDVDIKWQEEVRMEDGEMLLVDRTAKGKMSKGELSSPWGWRKTEMSVEVHKLPPNWMPPPVWHISKEYEPLLLSYQPQEHTWNIVVILRDCDDWKRLGLPALPYLQYQSKNGGPWQVIPLEQRLIGREANFLLSPSYKGEPLRELTKWLQGVIPNYKETPNLVTVEEKGWRNRNAFKSFQSIVTTWKDNNCSPNSEGKFNISWKEEVRMLDGETLLIYRATRGKKQAATEVSLEVLELPDDWVLPPIWRKEEDYQSQEPTWTYVPILLDYQPQEHTWSMVITFAVCLGWERLGRPDLPYVQYQSKNGEPWQVVPLEERLIGRKTNVFSGKRFPGQSKLTVEEKEKFYSSAADRFREILATWSNNCSPNLEGK